MKPALCVVFASWADRLAHKTHALHDLDACVGRGEAATRRAGLVTTEVDQLYGPSSQNKTLSLASRSLAAGSLNAAGQPRGTRCRCVKSSLRAISGGTRAEIRPDAIFAGLAVDIATCRFVSLDAAFGLQAVPSNCGICDVCQGRATGVAVPAFMRVSVHRCVRKLLADTASAQYGVSVDIASARCAKAPGANVNCSAVLLRALIVAQVIDDVLVGKSWVVRRGMKWPAWAAGLDAHDAQVHAASAAAQATKDKATADAQAARDKATADAAHRAAAQKANAAARKTAADKVARELAERVATQELANRKAERATKRKHENAGHSKPYKKAYSSTHKRPRPGAGTRRSGR